MVKYGIEIFARVKPGKGRLGVRNLTCVYCFMVSLSVNLWQKLLSVHVHKPYSSFNSTIFHSMC